MQTSEDLTDQYNRFGYEWHRFRDILPAYERQFRAWVAPLEEEDFAGRTVLDAGCGTGRNSLWPLAYGAEQVTAFDIDPRTVAVARRNLAEQEKATVEQHSIYDLPWENEFDLAFSIGVIHHLEDPHKAVANLVRAVRPGGTVLLWVYGQHGASTLKRFIKGVLPLTSRIPPGLLNILTAPLSLLLYLAIKIGGKRHPYTAQFCDTPFWHVHSIVFDQFLPRISNYWTSDEVKALFDGLPMDGVDTHDCNRGSWTVMAKKSI